MNTELPSAGDFNLLENMHNEGDTDKLVYALYLNQESTGWISAENSTLNFGNLNITRFSEATSFTYIAADLSAGTWKVQVTQPAFDGIAILGESKTGLLSTTQSKLTVPHKVYKAIYDAICISHFSCEAEGSDIVWNCSDKSQSSNPDLTLTVGGVQVTLTALDYTLKRDLYCRLRLQEGDSWVLGTAFLTKFYTVFDFDQQRVGIAIARHKREMATWLLVLIIASVVFICCSYVCRDYLYPRIVDKIRKWMEKRREREYELTNPLLAPS